MVNVAQLVRAADCGSVGRGFEPHLSPNNQFMILDFLNPILSLLKPLGHLYQCLLH
jgi:hypothetical protein